MPISVLFSGHMIDRPGRDEPRFPAHLAEAARDRIAQAIETFAYDSASSGDDIMGFASCADGGDIIFHEQCRLRDIQTMIVLPFPPEVFLRESVAGLPDDTWRYRFLQLWNYTPSKLRVELHLPVTDAAYEACNIQLLKRARQHGKVFLIALWDGQTGKSGGTADLVKRARQVTDPKSRDIFSPAALTWST